MGQHGEGSRNKKGGRTPVASSDSIGCGCGWVGKLHDYRRHREKDAPHKRV